jgi:hypothetical protein
VSFGQERDHENGTDTWLTPRWVLEPLGEFDLDPCAHPKWPIAKEHYYWPEQDGLWLPWRGRVWCNPPYGELAKPFVERMALHGNGLLLIFARTETEMFRRNWDCATAMLYLYQRIAFLDENLKQSDGGRAPSVLIAYGRENVEVLRAAKLSGQLPGALVTEWIA